MPGGVGVGLKKVAPFCYINGDKLGQEVHFTIQNNDIHGEEIPDEPEALY